MIAPAASEPAVSEPSQSEPTARAELRVVSTGASAVEIAAASVVLEAALDELAADDEVGAAAARSGWALSQAGLRSPIQPGEGRWRSFTG
ncbi:MAG: hypothetical protein LH471_04680 [Salinibacterium sp.]|nr:hypothetical protein [Salinibacterium sp.]